MKLKSRRQRLLGGEFTALVYRMHERKAGLDQTKKESECGLPWLVWIQELSEYRQKLAEFEKRFGASSHEVADEKKEIESKFGKGSAD